ncbi:hypothetical protein GCM10011579_097300 [Streptomyces albiflavescens]|uniref:Uncharacterized protein n=1 Tax=Streptomyces albiflavescens TaxID=1623582 RepID=A0A917YG56_9ACTN|nr:hypothetical protein GCM10011579_097300 [Streptomyces albiflavescens]
MLLLAVDEVRQGCPKSLLYIQSVVAAEAGDRVPAMVSMKVASPVDRASLSEALRDVMIARIEGACELPVNQS